MSCICSLFFFKEKYTLISVCIKHEVFFLSLVLQSRYQSPEYSILWTVLFCPSTETKLRMIVLWEPGSLKKNSSEASLFCLKYAALSCNLKEKSPGGLKGCVKMHRVSGGVVRRTDNKYNSVSYKEKLGLIWNSRAQIWREIKPPHLSFSKGGLNPLLI